MGLRSVMSRGHRSIFGTHLMKGWLFKNIIFYGGLFHTRWYWEINGFVWFFSKIMPFYLLSVMLNFQWKHLNVKYNKEHLTTSNERDCEYVITFESIFKQWNQFVICAWFVCKFSSLKRPGHLRGNLPWVYVLVLGTVHKQQIQNQTKYWRWWKGWCDLLAHRIYSRKCS